MVLVVPAAGTIIGSENSFGYLDATYDYTNTGGGGDINFPALYAMKSNLRTALLVAFVRAFTPA